MYFETRNLIVGDYFNGVALASNDTFYAISDNVHTIRELRSNFGAPSYPTENEVLEIAKNVHKENIYQQHDDNLKTVFEYPLGSGKTFPINNDEIQNYNALMLYKDVFTYTPPYRYNGNDGAFVEFTSSADIAAFHGAAFTTYNTETATRYNPAFSAIEAVVITTTLEDALTAVFAVTY